jgi:hypothetical protein
MKDKIRTILKEWLQTKDAIIFTDDIAIEEVTDEIYDTIAERMPTEVERMKKEEVEATKRKWEELDRKSTELLDKYFAEHTREEIMADLGIKNTLIQKIKYWFRSRREEKK